MHGKISRVVGQIKDDAARILATPDDQVQGYANQLQQCRNMRHNLETLQGELAQIAQHFHASLMTLQSQEYIGEELKNIARVVAEFGPMAEALSNHLSVRHVAYIDDRAKQITVTLNEALGG